MSSVILKDSYVFVPVGCYIMSIISSLITMFSRYGVKNGHHYKDGEPIISKVVNLPLDHLFLSVDRCTDG